MPHLQFSSEAVAPERLWLAQEVVDEILADTDTRAPLETGGMLLGYVSVDKRDVVVTTTIAAGPRARRRRYSFRPDGRWQQRRLAALYESSGRMTTFVGDWHCHPDGQAVPSRRDLRTAKKTAQRRRARAPHPVVLIIGGGESDERIRAWVYANGRLREVPWAAYRMENDSAKAD